MRTNRQTGRLLFVLVFAFEAVATGPGAPLARMEMRVAVEELLAHTACMEPVPERPPTTAVYPGSGFAALPLRIR